MQSRKAPKGFNKKVYRRGRRWLRKNGHPLQGPAIGKDGRPIKLRAYWRACLQDLYDRYDGVCAYVSIYIDRVTGARSVDHFVAKSSAVEHAYRWSNYRLACGKVNGRKGTFDDLLDPFQIEEQTFLLNLLTGRIYPNPRLPQPLRDQAQLTIDRLGLDDADCKLARLQFLDDYREKRISDAYLKERCPFVWYEVHR
ncbi:MAG TPA: hypothetical protein VLS89_10345 [Candidatus Nanopelagicales bacterium]|nr:hypothetical protein [Candidatus Nanopelagicales bacterium]